MIKLTKLLFASMMSVCLLSGCSSSKTKEFTVNFYKDNQLYSSQQVKEGECAVEPVQPYELERNFLYWCTDLTLQNRYIFSTPVVSDLSLYSLFENLDPFTDYKEDYRPANGPFLCDQQFFDGDKDIEIVLTSDGIMMNDSISIEQVLLSGGFEDLKISSVTSENQVVTIRTTGTVKNETGYVSFSKATNKSKIFLTTPIKIDERQVPSISIDKATYSINKRNKDVSFSLVTKYQSLVHGELTPEEYLEKIKDGTFKYFSITENDKYEFSVTAIHEDFNGFNAKVHVKDDFNDEVINDICNNIKLIIAEEALDDGLAHELNFEFNVPQTISSLLITPMKKDNFRGDYRIHAVGSRFSQSLVDNISTLLTYPNNKNLFITIPDAEVVLSSINIANDYEIYGKLDIITQSDLKNANVSLNEIKIGETLIDPLYKIFTDEKIDVEIESTPVVFGYDSTKTGTINQDEGASYLGVKSYIQDLSLDEADTTIDDLIFIGTSLGKFAYGVYSGDYVTAGDAVGKAFGLDFLRNPALLMLDRLADIMDKLQEIENRIQEISEKIDDLKKELEEVGQQTVLNTFLEAYNIWNAFKSQYYAPMMDEVRNYTTAYYRYYYDFAIASNPDSVGEKASIDIYYDTNGNVVFPADNYVYSVDGKIIDKSKTKTVSFPELTHTLAGIRHNSGHAYTSIEEDIIADLTSFGTYSDEELAEILKTLTFNAMKSHFSNQTAIDSFTNTFKNFCEAITASDIVSSISIAPLECFSILLKTVFNFGFEIEPDLNLVAVKLQSSFYAAKKIFSFVVSINAGDIDVNIYKDLISKVEDELSSTRFYRSNDENGNVFSFVSNCYIEAATKAYGIQFTCKDNGGGDIVNNAKIVADDFKNIDAEPVKDFVSVTEEDIAFMKIKVEIYNLIKGTNYSFKGYLGKIGIIPKEVFSMTFGILTKIDGIVKGEDDVDDLSHPGDYHQAAFSSPNATPEITYNKYDSIDDFYWDGEYVYGLKGKMISFDTGDSYEMLAAFTATRMKNAYGDYVDKPLGFFGDGINIGYFFNDYRDAVCVWSYYVSFRVIQTESQP